MSGFQIFAADAAFQNRAPPRLLSGEGKLILLFVKRQGFGSNLEVLIRPSTSDVSAQL